MIPLPAPSSAAAGCAVRAAGQRRGRWRASQISMSYGFEDVAAVAASLGSSDRAAAPRTGYVS